jgi:hypothetical protein
MADEQKTTKKTKRRRDRGRSSGYEEKPKRTRAKKGR